MRNAEEDVENLRRKITREVAEIGSLMVYREDILRTVTLWMISRATSVESHLGLET